MHSFKEEDAQEPTFQLVPKYTHTYGMDAGELVKHYGFTLDPWQQSVLNSWLGVNDDELFTATSCGLSVPRQNGKNALLEARELYGMVTGGERILHTAHEVKTARKAFLRLCSFFENERQFPELAEMVSCIRKTNGQEAIELNNGGSVEFSARSRGAARGFTVDSVIFDEAQELTDEQIEALLPTLAAAPSGNRQFIYTGTPTPPTSPGDVFYSLRETAHDKSDETLAWHEWAYNACLPREIEWEDVKEITKRVNPALGYRIDIDFCKKEFYSLSRDGYSRERLGWWQNIHPTSTPAIDAREWADGSVNEHVTSEGAKRALGVKFDITSMFCAISCAEYMGQEASVYVELLDIVDCSRGLSELVGRLEAYERKCAAVAVDGAGGKGNLLNLCQERGVAKHKIMNVRTYDMCSAASMLADAIAAAKLEHVESPALDEAALTSTKRKIGKSGGWSWDGDGAYIMESVSLALWAARTTKRDPNRKMRLL